MNTCQLCQDICCPEHCCNWDECTCGDCDMCKPHSEAQPTQTQVETQNPTLYNDNAKIILIGKAKEIDHIKEKTRPSSENNSALLQNGRDKEEYMFQSEETKEERKSLPNNLIEEEKSDLEDIYDIDLIRRAAGGGIHGIRYLKKKSLS